MAQNRMETGDDGISRMPPAYTSHQDIGKEPYGKDGAEAPELAETKELR